MANLRLRGRSANARLHGSSEARRHVQRGRHSKISKLDLWTRIAQIASALSVMVGIILAVAEIYKASYDIKESIHTAKLNALPSVKEMIKEDGDIRTKALSDFGGTWDEERIRKALDAHHGNVAEAYYSDDLAPVRTMGHHYEVLGELVEADVLDFKLIYEVVDFPDGFWDATEELRTRAKSSWTVKDGRPKGLPDFWQNFSKLHERYDQQRKRDEEERRKAKKEP
jgi:hypothetical protein